MQNNNSENSNSNVLKLIKLNQDFYKQIGIEFDKTRRYFWQGWYELKNILATKKIENKEEKLKILDIGCGNGRLAEFFEQETDYKTDYLGLDFDQTLLLKAKEKFKKHTKTKIKANFLKYDIFDTNNLLNKDNLEKVNFQTNDFNLIALFGVIHHLPPQLSLDFFTNLKTFLTNSNAILIFSVWDFMNFESVKKKVIKDKTELEQIYQKYKIDSSNLDQNDYFLAWNKGSKAVRYCHYYEHNKVLEILNQLNLKLITTYQADGKEGKVNRYYLLTQTPLSTN
jgi:SAM-dependent methyltransferase